MIDSKFNRMLRISIFKNIEHSIEQQFEKDNLRDFIASTVKKIVSDTLNLFIKDVVSGVVQETIRRLDYKLELTKKISLSIDSEIKHMLRNLPISYTEEQACKDIILKQLESLRKDFQLQKDTILRLK